MRFLCLQGLRSYHRHAPDAKQLQISAAAAVGPKLTARLNEEVQKGAKPSDICTVLASIRFNFSGSAAVQHPNTSGLS